MSVIKARTFSSIVDNRIRLSNSNAARLWSSDIGTSWTHIRIGCRLSIEDTGANLTATPQFFFGICSGTSNLFLDATTTHWAGIRSKDPSWLRAAGPPASYSFANATINPVAAKKVGATITDTASTAYAAVHAADCTTANRVALFLDITKGTPWVFNVFAKQNANAGDVDIGLYLSQIVLSTPVITDHNSSSAIGGTMTLTIDEATNGFFNAVNFGWDRVSPAIEISDIAIVKFS